MMKKVTVWLDEKYNGVLTVTAVGNEAIRTNVAVAGTALEDADVIIIRPGGDIRYEKEGDYPSGPTGHLTALHACGASQGEERETAIIDAVPVDKMELQQLSIDTRTRMAKAVFRFGDKRITLCRDCGELAPVVHGRWETNNDPEEIVKDFSCSVCEELLCDFDTYALTPGENCFYYCPNCGAKMDGGNDAENH